MLATVNSNKSHAGRITQIAGRFVKQLGLVLVLVVLIPFHLLVADDAIQQDPSALQREQFSRAWHAATRGQRDIFRKSMPGLTDYVLYPYLQYEDMRFRRATVSAAEMSTFLDSHEDWAFTAGLAENAG